MEDYKGLYHNDHQTTSYYEHGAHFKYSDLVDALNNLIKKDKKSKESESKENKEIKKRINKYKFKTYKENGNLRYKDNNNEKEEYQKNDDRKYDNIFERNSLHISKKKILNPINRSVDRTNISLPKINISNNSNSVNKSNFYSLTKKTLKPKDLRKLIIDSEYNNIQIIKDDDFNDNEKNKEDLLPRIDYHKKTKKEREYRKNNEELNLYSVKREKNKRNNKLFLNEINNKKEIINTENENSKGIIHDRLRSIFEIDKQVKKNSLLNDLRNNYSKNYIETIKNDISKQIYQLRKSLLVNANKRDSF